MRPRNAFLEYDLVKLLMHPIHHVSAGRVVPYIDISPASTRDQPNYMFVAATAPDHEPDFHFLPVVGKRNLHLVVRPVNVDSPRAVWFNVNCDSFLFH